MSESIVLGLKITTKKVSKENYQFIKEELDKGKSKSEFLRYCIDITRLYKNLTDRKEKRTEEKNKEFIDLKLKVRELQKENTELEEVIKSLEETILDIAKIK